MKFSAFIKPEFALPSRQKPTLRTYLDPVYLLTVRGPYIVIYSYDEINEMQ